MSEDQWYLEALQNYLTTSEWRQVVTVFVKSHCKYFSDIEDYHPQQYIIWKNFQDLAENLLDNTLMSLGGSLDILEKALDKMKNRPSRGPRDEVTKEVIDKLLAFESFPTFAEMMNGACHEVLQEEGLRECDQNSLMRMGFTVSDITSAYDEIGHEANLEDMIMFLSAKVVNAEAEMASVSKKSSKHQKKHQQETGHNDFKESKEAISSSDNAYYDNLPQSSQYSSSYQKFISEANDHYQVKIDPNELNAKFVIADSVLSNYQQTVLLENHQNNDHNRSTTEIQNQDQLLALTRWASEMKSLQSDLDVAFNEDILCSDLTFNHPKGLVEWYFELETLRHAINDSYHHNNNTAVDNPLLISDSELQRMAELDKIAAMGTENEQKLHFLLSKHENIRRDIFKLYQKCNILINTNKMIQRNLIEEVYLLLKEKVKGGNTAHIGYGANWQEYPPEEDFDIWNEPLIQKMLSYDQVGMDIIHFLLELHLLEDEQQMMKQEINQLVGNSPTNRENKGQSSNNGDHKSPFFDESRGTGGEGNGGSGGGGVGGVDHLEGMFNFDEKMLTEMEENHQTNNMDGFDAADAKQNSSSSYNDAKNSSASDFKQLVAEEKQEAKQFERFPVASAVPVTDNKGSELLDSLKTRHRQSLNNLKESLALIKQQQLSNLENRLLMKKKLLTTAKQSVKSREDELFIENEEKEIQQIENSLYNETNNLTLLENSLLDGFKSRCIYELKTGKQIVNNQENPYKPDTVEELLEQIHPDRTAENSNNNNNPSNSNNNSELVKSILEKYEKEKNYLLSALQQQKLKQLNKLQKRLANRQKERNTGAKNTDEDYNNEDREIQAIQQEISFLDEQFSAETANSLHSLHNNLLLTIAGSEMNDNLLLSSFVNATHARKDEMEDDEGKGLDDYLVTDQEKLMKNNFPVINYLNQLNKMKDKYLTASDNLYNTLIQKKVHSNDLLSQRKKKHWENPSAGTGATTVNKEILEEEKIINEEIIGLVDSILLDSYQDHLNDLLEKSNEMSYESYHLSEKLKKISLTGSGKQPQQKNKTTGKKGVEDEDDDDLNERMKIGILNAFEKSKQSYDQRQKNSQLTSKDLLNKRLQQKKDKNNNKFNNEQGGEEEDTLLPVPIIDEDTEVIMEEFLDHFLEPPVKQQQQQQPSPLSKAKSFKSPKKLVVLEEPLSMSMKSLLPGIGGNNSTAGEKNHRITRDMVESSSGAKDWDESHYDSSYNSYSGINKNTTNNLDKDRIRAVHEEKEKQLVRRERETFYSLLYYFNSFLWFSAFRWTVYIRIWSKRGGNWKKGTELHN
jgi:hypothetical protein